MHSLAELDWKCKLRDHRNWKQCAYIFSINAASGPNPAQNLRTSNYEIRNLWHQIVFRANDTLDSTNGMYQETLHLRLACQQRLRDTNISALSVSRWIFYIFFQLLGACRAGKFPGTAGTTTFVKGFWSQKNANKNHWERTLQRKSPKKSLKHQRQGCLGWGLTAGRTYMLDYNYTKKVSSWTIAGGAMYLKDNTVFQILRQRSCVDCWALYPFLFLPR